MRTGNVVYLFKKFVVLLAMIFSFPFQSLTNLMTSKRRRRLSCQFIYSASYCPPGVEISHHIGILIFQSAPIEAGQTSSRSLLSLQ